MNTSALRSTSRYEYGPFNGTVDHNENEITDLGGVNLGNNNFRLGYPIGGVWGRAPTGFSVKTTGTDVFTGARLDLRGRVTLPARSATVLELR